MKKAQNFEIVAGDTANLNVSVTDRSGSKDLTGATIKWALWDDITQTAVMTKTTADAITVISAIAGQFTVALVPADTIAVTPGKYSHQCEVTDGSGNVSTIFIGAVSVLQSQV
jgi:hypothetical protein